MEAHNSDQLQILTAKTWDLHVRINEKITQHGFSFCSHCSNHGRYCVVSKSNVEEREKMMAIRDSLKELHNILLFLQRLNTRHKIENDEALARLEESKKMLIEMTNECSKLMERSDEVLEEVMKLVGDGKGDDEFPWNLKMEMDEKIDDDEMIKKNGNRVSRFLVRTTRFGLEFVAILACIYTSVRFCESRKQNHHKDSMMGKSEFLLTACPQNIDLDVSFGRG